MSERKKQQKIGTAYRLGGQFTSGKKRSLVLDPDMLAGMSSEMTTLVHAGIVMTLSPDWRTLCLYCERRWNELRHQLINLNNEDPGARRVQRVMLGSATPNDIGNGLLEVSPFLVTHAGLEGELILVVFSSENAELWSSAELERMANELPGTAVGYGSAP